MRWILLLLTVVCAYMTYDAFGWRSNIPKTPLSNGAGSLIGEQNHLSLEEQHKIRDHLASSMFAGKIVWLLLCGTILLGALTIQAFMA